MAGYELFDRPNDCQLAMILVLIGYDVNGYESRLEDARMLGYFLLFTGIGIAIGYLVKDQKQALISALVISALWGLSSRAIWGFVTLGELLLGYFVYVAFIAQKDQSSTEGTDGQEKQ